MNLKTCTLLAIIGNLIAFFGGLFLRVAVAFLPHSFIASYNILWTVLSFLGSGTLILFLIALYSKQK